MLVELRCLDGRWQEENEVQHLLRFFNSHEALAAWVQAFGSLLIIGATAIIAMYQSHEARRHEREMQREVIKREKKLQHELKMLLISAADNCIDAYDKFLKHWYPASIGDVVGEFMRTYDQHEFLIPLEYLAAVPLQQLGDPVLLTAVLKFRTSVSAVMSKLDSAGSDQYKIRNAIMLCSENRTVVFNNYASILRLARAGEETDKRLSQVAGRC